MTLWFKYSMIAVKRCMGVSEHLVFEVDVRSFANKEFHNFSVWVFSCFV